MVLQAPLFSAATGRLKNLKKYKQSGNMAILKTIHRPNWLLLLFFEN